MHETESIHGIVDRIVFHNNENGFAVFIIQLNAKQTATVKGHIPSLTPGQQISVSGSWIMHPKFGKQFDAKSCTAQIPTSIIGLKKYLSSGLVKGIGPVYGEKLVNFFGEQVLEVIDKTPDRLKEVPGIGEKRIEKIVTAWKDQKEISHIMVFLQEKGISSVYATKIYKHYRAHAIEVILENPYRLAQDIWGIGFKTADQIAQNIGIAPTCKKRITAAILHTIQTAAGDGHLYCELTQLKQQTATLLEIEFETIEHTIKLALHDLHNTDKIKLITHHDIHYITLPSFYYSEKGVAQKLENILQYPSHCTFDIEKISNQLRTQPNKNDIDLNEDQQHGILACLQNKVTVITGGPGTGKTTLIKKLLTILDDNKTVYRLAAPTGRAAKRISESTSKPATTIHRLLEFDVSIMGFTRNENNALVVDYLIIDEASMIDIFLAYALIKALPSHTHLLLIGDIDQLPSVGAGNFLHDIIESKKITTITLTTIFRQAQNSLIIINAHRINNGQMPTTAKDNTVRDFIFIKEDDPQNIPLHLHEIYTKALPRLGIRSEESILLTPMHRGVAGTQKLNHDLQQMLNGSENKHILYNGAQFKIDDRVMQLTNNYDKLVFNGDIGIIEEVDSEEKLLTIRFFDRLIQYDSTELNELVHAYAISIHKSQGSEFSVVIIPIFMQHFMMLQRNLIYTAITRAKKLCIFIGQTRAIAIGVKNNKNVERITFLQQFLTSDLKCR